MSMKLYKNISIESQENGTHAQKSDKTAFGNNNLKANHSENRGLLLFFPTDGHP